MDAAQTGITSLLATDIKIGEDDQTKIDFETADTINFYAGNEKQLILTDGALTPGTNAILDLGTDALEFKDAYFDGTVEADAITIAGVSLAETIADTVGAMVGSNTETGIAVTYDDSDNTLDFVLGTITSLGTIGTGVWQGTAIASAYIAADAITSAKIADNALDSEHYTDGSIDTAHLAADSVTGAKIADDAIDSEHYTNASIDLAHMSVNSIDSDQYVDGSIDLVHMSANSVDSDQYVDGSIDTVHLATGAVTDLGTITQDTITFTSANANDPLVVIKNTTNDTAAARLHFVKDKGAAGADGDDIGTIEFISDDAAQTQTTFAKIVAEVSESADSDEAGKLSFFVAESDGTTTALAAGLVLEGEHATNGEVDVTIGAGVASTTTIAGNVYAAGGKFGIDTGDYMQFTANTQTDFYVNGNNEMRLEADGDLHVDGDVVGYSTTIGSDEKIKTNISPIEGAIDKLKQINGVTFNYKRNNKPSGGVIAQNIEKVMPSLVGEQETLDGKDTFKTVDYNGIIGLLIESVKELEERLSKCECNKN